MPAINIGFLLAAGDKPSLLWQTTSGVNVAVGHNQEEVNQAYALLSEVAKEQYVGLYIFGTGTPAMVFAGVNAYEARVRPDRRYFSVTHPHDWMRGFLVRDDPSNRPAREFDADR